MITYFHHYADTRTLAERQAQARRDLREGPVPPYLFYGGVLPDYEIDAFIRARQGLAPEAAPQPIQKPAGDFSDFLNSPLGSEAPEWTAKRKAREAAELAAEVEAMAREEDEYAPVNVDPPDESGEFDGGWDPEFEPPAEQAAAPAAPALAPAEIERPAPASEPAELLPVDPVAAELSVWHDDDAIRFDFGIDLKLVEEFLTTIGVKLPKPSKRSNRREEVLRAFGAIIASAIMAADAGRRCSYSRRPEHFSLRKAYEGKPYTYTNIVGGIEALVDKKVLDHRVAKGGKHREVGVQSTFWAMPALLEAFDGVELKRPSELKMPLRLRDERGNLVSFKHSDVTRALMADLNAINGWMRTFKVTLPGVQVTKRGQYVFEKVIIEDGKKKLIRSVVCPTEFPQVYQMGSRGDETFEVHGRYYGFWQNVPSDQRAGLMLNGQRCVEIDFSALHPTLLYAQCGIDIVAEGFDPYKVPGYEAEEMRRCCKLALNVGINAKSRAEAVNAFMARRRLKGDKKWRLSRKATEALLDAVIAHNPRIADMIASDAGIRLMRVDSRIIREVLFSCMAASIPCLPVHDSVIVPARFQAQVQAIMGAAYCKVVGVSTPCRVKVSDKAAPVQKPYKKIPQTGESAGAALADGPSPAPRTAVPVTPVRRHPVPRPPVVGALGGGLRPRVTPLRPAPAYTSGVPSGPSKGAASSSAGPVASSPARLSLISSLKVENQLQERSECSDVSKLIPSPVPRSLSIPELQFIDHEVVSDSSWQVSDQEWTEFVAAINAPLPASEPVRDPQQEAYEAETALAKKELARRRRARRKDEADRVLGRGKYRIRPGNRDVSIFLPNDPWTRVARD